MALDELGGVYLPTCMLPSSDITLCQFEHLGTEAETEANSMYI